MNDFRRFGVGGRRNGETGNCLVVNSVSSVQLELRLLSINELTVAFRDL